MRKRFRAFYPCNIQREAEAQYTVSSLKNGCLFCRLSFNNTMQTENKSCFYLRSDLIGGGRPVKNDGRQIIDPIIAFTRTRLPSRKNIGVFVTKHREHHRLLLNRILPVYAIKTILYVYFFFLNQYLSNSEDGFQLFF